MKKIYITPCVQLTNVELQTMIAESAGVYSTTVSGEKGGWVKEDSPSTSNFNVWDDDWSK